MLGVGQCFMGRNMLVDSVAMRSFTGLTVITVVFLIAGALLIACNRTVDRKARRIFIICLAALVCLALFDWYTYYTNGWLPEHRWLHTIVVTITFAGAPFLPLLIAQTIYPDRRIRWVVALLIIQALIEVVNVFGGFIFWVDETNLYHRGSMYWIYMAAYTVSSIYLIIATIRLSRAYQTAQAFVVFGIIACMFTGIIIQIFDIDVRMTWPAVSMSVILYFLFYSDMVLRTDALTMLLNRRSFQDALDHPPLPSIAVIVDIDDFKNVNDTHGHPYGDACLTRIAHMIRRSFSSAGLCYRTGGDEFAVIMSKRLDDVELLSAELKRLIANAQREDGRMPSVSIGYAPASADGLDIHEAFRVADQSMYRVKRTGRDA